MNTTEKPIRLHPTPTPAQTRYILREVIGEGGMGVVYRATDTALGRNVAIKKIHTQHCNAGANLSNTLGNEASILASLSHPNIVTVHDVYSENGSVFIVIELLDGKTLDRLPECGRMEVTEFADLVNQTQDALAAANDQNITHGDLKPQNIIRTQLSNGKFQYKLLDFDQASLIGQDPQLSQQRVACGSPHFMAPERFQGNTPTRASDTYAMGCIYFYMLTGQFPFQGSNNVEIMASHMRHEITPLSQLRPDLPAWIGKWIDWLLSSNSNDRPQSPIAVLASFNELMQRLSSVPETAIAILPKSPEPKADWHIARGSIVRGPYQWKAIQEFISSGVLLGNDLVRSSTMEHWVKAASIANTAMKSAG